MRVWHRDSPYRLNSRSRFQENGLTVKLAYGLVLLLPLPLMMSQNAPNSNCSTGTGEIAAVAISRDIQLDAQHPSPEWQTAGPVSFCADWQGKNADPGRQTKVRVLWSTNTLYLRFECRYRELFVFEDSDPNGRRDQLWDRDVAEVFLQPDPSRPRFYKEFEVSPNGFWIDLDISPEPLQDLKSGMQHSVWLDETSHNWFAEISIPMKALTDHFDPGVVWRTNFFRVEGRKEPRFYSAWQPTGTPEPNFHVPSAFGRLRFAPLKSR
jgi:hypothetical protein